MAQRNSTKTVKQPRKVTAKVRSAASSKPAMERRVVALAEQVGRIVGTVQAKTEGWLDRSGARRVKAADATSGDSPRSGRSGGVVDAPGKKHRQPMPSRRGTTHSDTRIAKLKIANESRRRGGGR